MRMKRWSLDTPGHYGKIGASKKKVLISELLGTSSEIVDSWPTGLVLRYLIGLGAPKTPERNSGMLNEIQLLAIEDYPG